MPVRTTRQSLLFTLLLSLALVVGAQPARAETYIPSLATAPAVVSTPSTLYLPLTGSSFCMSRRPEASVFGLQKYNDTSVNSPVFTQLLNSQASWLRVTVWRSQVPGSGSNPSGYNWTAADRALAAAKDACMNLIVTVEWSPGWNEDHNENTIVDGKQVYPYGNPFGAAKHTQFAQFMQAMVERYDGDGIQDNPQGLVVRYWEIYNEPDFDTRWGKRGTEYATMLQVAKIAIDAASPEAVVVMGGIAYDGFVENGGRFVKNFMRSVLAAGGGNHFDVMNYHYYPGFRPDWAKTNQGTGLKEKHAALTALLDEFDVDKPIILTETSWHSNDDDSYPSSPEIQSRYVVQLATQTMAYGMGMMIWWPLQDTTGINNPLESGLVTSTTPIQRKPSYTVFQQGANWLGAATFQATVLSPDGANNLEAHRFRNSKGQTFYVAWLNPVTANTTQPLQVPGQTATVYSKEGAPVATVTDGSDGVGDGQITVQVGGSPAYILITQP